MRRLIRDQSRIHQLLSMCLLGGMFAVTLVACSGTDTGSAPDAGWVEPSTEHSQVLSFDQFRNQARVFSNERPDGYVIESHIRVHSEESLLAYYKAVYQEPVEKSVGWTIGGTLGHRSAPTNIRYCLSSGWGAAIGAFTAPAKSTVVDQIAKATARWQGVTKVVFKYMSGLDGAACTTANIANGTLAVDFVVRPTGATSCTASGAFPWMALSDQALDIPSCALPGFLGDHELGHVLGLRHEMEHSQNNCGYTPSSGDTDLTPYDTGSVMFYTSCTGDASSRSISTLDGVGIRKIYGPPDWWWGSLI